MGEAFLPRSKVEGCDHRQNMAWQVWQWKGGVSRLFRQAGAFVLCAGLLVLQRAHAGDWRIVAQTVGASEAVVETIATTLDQLRENFPEERFELSYYDNKGLREELARGRPSTKERVGSMARSPGLPS